MPHVNFAPSSVGVGGPPLAGECPSSPVAQDANHGHDAPISPGGDGFIGDLEVASPGGDGSIGNPSTPVGRSPTTNRSPNRSASVPASSRGAPQSQTSIASSMEDTSATKIVDEAQECLAQSLLMFLYADLRLLSATGRINTKFETLCIDSDRVPRTTAAQMANLEGNPLPRDIASLNDSCEGVTPGQVMAILFVELRQEVLEQRRRVKEQMAKEQAAGWLGTVVNDSSNEDEESDEGDEDLDAGVMNKITDRKGRKEFETDMHALIRSYNDMLAQDLKGIPDVKVERMFTNPLRMPTFLRSQQSATNEPNNSTVHRPWLRPGGLTQRLFSFDEGDPNAPADQQSARQHDSDEEGSKSSKSSATGRMRSAARGLMFTNLLRKSNAQGTSVPQQGPPTQVELTAGSTEGVGSIEIPDLAGSGSGPKSSGASRRPKLSLIEESKSEQSDSEKSRDDEQTDEPTAQVSESNMGASEGDPKDEGELPRSKLSEIIESVRGMRASASPRDCDVASLKSDPGPNHNHSWLGEGPDASLTGTPGSRPPLHRRKSTLKQQLTQLTDYVERYREDHALHNKYIIPTDDYETFAGAEDVGNKLVNMRASINLSMMGPVPELAEVTSSDPGRNMTEDELLDFMTKCIESRNCESLDFMSDFFRSDTISQTMVKSKAQVVWLQDWFPIKDCIYAISVDKKKKRVLVVFRGAITRADWSHGFDAAMKRGHNPVEESYEGKKSYIKIHRGFYTYMFRTRKDTQTRKYDEIAGKVHEYGTKLIGSNNYTVTVNGYSLGGALSVLFGFYASTDERFTRNGPVKIFSYGAPYAVSHGFADAFRHQEMARKVQHARFYNSNDLVAHMPFNAKPTHRGSNFVHVGIDVKLYSVPGRLSMWGSRYPRFHYNERQKPAAAYWRAIKLNSLLNMPLPWQIKNKHGLPELQKRIARAKLVAEVATTTKNPYLVSTLDEAYEAMVYKKEE